MPPETQLQTLATLLLQTRFFWDQRPFRERPAPWEATLPAVSVWLRALTTTQIDALETDPFGGPAMPPALAAVRDAAAAATSLPTWPVSGAELRAPMRRVKGRKQAQISAFQRAVATPLRAAAPRRIVDWCGGKGHLSRALALRCDCPVCVVDREPSLVAEAEQLGADAGVTVRGVAADVTVACAPAALDRDTALVALHACGHLTDAAVAAAITREVPWLGLVPCCHHRVPAGGWRPMSATLAATGLHLNVNGLRLAIADEGPATPRARARRRKEMCWRIGADMLLAERSPTPAPTPLGAIRRSAYSLNFEDFCRQALAPRKVTLPATWRADTHLERAVETTREVRALALARGQLRRAVEVLCVLDRAQALSEAGWRVDVGTFCARTITPRNLLVIAQK